MGNAMGLVRTIRAGALHYAAAATRGSIPSPAAHPAAAASASSELGDGESAGPGQDGAAPPAGRFLAAAAQLAEQGLCSEAHAAAARVLDDAVAQLHARNGKGGLALLCQAPRVYSRCPCLHALTTWPAWPLACSAFMEAADPQWAEETTGHGHFKCMDGQEKDSSMDGMNSLMLATGADYYGMLVAVFQREAAAPAHAHLAAFHALVPALTLAAVEAALLSKEALQRQRRRGPVPKEAGFTDDGFTLGLAYLLKARRAHDVHALLAVRMPLNGCCLLLSHCPAGKSCSSERSAGAAPKVRVGWGPARRRRTNKWYVKL